MEARQRPPHPAASDVMSGRMYFFWITLQLAFRILTRYRLRTGLTMLGIVIGVGAVVAMVSMGQGAEALIQAQIASLGTNVIIVIPGAMAAGGVRTGTGAVSTLSSQGDAREILKRVSGVSAVSSGFGPWSRSSTKTRIGAPPLPGPRSPTLSFAIGPSPKGITSRRLTKIVARRWRSSARPRSTISSRI